jgi:acetylglutamate kinase
VLRTRQLDERLGFVGEVTAVDAAPLDALLGAGYLPVVAPVGLWEAEGRRRQGD